MADSHLQGLPIEILLRIGRLVTTSDLGHLRLTCKSVENALYPSFVREFFTIKQFMIAEPSLQALIDISNSRLGCHLRRLQFGLEHYGHDDTRPWGRGTLGQGAEQRYHMRLASNDSFWSTGMHVEALVAAFRSLPNLEDIVVRDFDSRRRSGDGPGLRWRSYGANTMEEETSVPLSRRGCTYASQVFNAVLAAAAKADARPRHLELMLRYTGLPDKAFYVSQVKIPAMSACLQGLEKLHLDLRDEAWLDLAHLGSWNLRNFLSQTLNLKDLRINGNENMGGNTIRSLLDAINRPHDPAKASTDPMEPPAVLLPRLECFSTGKFATTPDRLLGLVKRLSPSLKELHIWKVALMVPEGQGGHGASGNDVHVGDDSPSLWVKFFERATRIPELNVHRIAVGMVQEIDERGISRSVRFAEKAGDDHQQGTFSYLGPDWKRNIEDLLREKRIGCQRHPRWPRSVSNHHDPDQDMDDDDDDDHDDEDGDDEEMQ